VSPRRPAIWLTAGVIVAALLVAGCGDGTKDLKVSAAASLRGAFTRFGSSFGHATFSYAGSDQLAAQIRAGARPDVFASANTKLPDALFASGLVERATPFATNRLVLAVPSHGAHVSSLADVARPGTRLVVGTSSVPVGAYTVTVLSRLGPLGRTIGTRVRSQEPSVDGIVAKLVTGSADAGYLYATDVQASHGALRALTLPASARPRVTYAAAVVRGAAQPARARKFIAGLLTGAGRAALATAGFGPPPA
jgi:molybdate transport system substrate-binding protein